MEKINYLGWPNCIRLTNEHLECVLTTDVGPRIIYLGFKDGRNLFANVTEECGRTGDDSWHIYGGHRLWHAPEQLPRTYYPDNKPVSYESESKAGFVRLIQETEPTTGLQKEIDITLHPELAQVTVTHRLRNHNMWAVEMAPWALSVMAAGGTAVMPLPPHQSHSENMLPTVRLNLWGYSDMSDPRWTWGSHYILLQQEPGNEVPQKVGALVKDGWVAYVNDGRLFVKTFAVQPDATYPDNHSNVELFTNDFMLEVESLGPLINLAPQAVVEHTENWHLFDNVPTPSNDAEVEEYILPLVQSIL